LITLTSNKCLLNNNKRAIFPVPFNRVHNIRNFTIFTPLRKSVILQKTIPHDIILKESYPKNITDNLPNNNYIPFQKNISEYLPNKDKTPFQGDIQEYLPTSSFKEKQNIIIDLYNKYNEMSKSLADKINKSMEKWDNKQNELYFTQDNNANLSMPHLECENNVFAGSGSVSGSSSTFDEYGFLDYLIQFMSVIYNELSIISLIITAITISFGYFIIEAAKIRPKLIQFSNSIETKDLADPNPVMNLQNVLNPVSESSTTVPEAWTAETIVDKLEELLKKLYHDRKQKGENIEHRVLGTHIGLSKRGEHIAMKDAMRNIMLNNKDTCPRLAWIEICETTPAWNKLEINLELLQYLSEIANPTPLLSARVTYEIIVNKLEGLLKNINQSRLEQNIDLNKPIFGSDIGLYLGGENRYLMVKILEVLQNNSITCPSQAKSALLTRNHKWSALVIDSSFIQFFKDLI